jgi:hypothetical protein
MCAAKHSKTTSAGGETSSVDITGEDSSHFLNVLGKRSTSDNSVEKLHQEVDGSHDSDDDSGTGDDGDKRERR